MHRLLYLKINVAPQNNNGTLDYRGVTEVLQYHRGINLYSLSHGIKELRIKKEKINEVTREKELKATNE